MSADETDAKCHPLETDLQSEAATAGSQSPSLQSKPMEMDLDIDKDKMSSQRGVDQQVASEDDMFLFNRLRAPQNRVMESIESQQQPQYTPSSGSTSEPSADFTNFSAVTTLSSAPHQQQQQQQQLVVQAQYTQNQSS